MPREKRESHHGGSKEYRHRQYVRANVAERLCYRCDAITAAVHAATRFSLGDEHRSQPLGQRLTVWQRVAVQTKGNTETATAPPPDSRVEAGRTFRGSIYADERLRPGGFRGQLVICE